MDDTHRLVYGADTGTSRIYFVGITIEFDSGEEALAEGNSLSTRLRMQCAMRLHPVC